MKLCQTSKRIEKACYEINTALKRKAYNDVIYRHKAAPILRKVCMKYNLSMEGIYKILEIKEA